MRTKVESQKRMGRPKKRWMCCKRDDQEEKGLTCNEVQRTIDWKRLVKNSGPAIKAQRAVKTKRKPLMLPAVFHGAEKEKKK